MTTLWWVRHGPTHERVFTGWRDVPADLSDTAALDRLSAFLPHHAVVVSSDLIRCVKTADALMHGERTRLPHHSDLREFHFGDWDGRSFDDVSNTHPELSREYWEAPGDAAPPGGESWNTAAARVSDAIDQLVHAHPEQDMIVVSHFGAILTQLQRALEVSAENVLAQPIDNLSVTELRKTQSTWQAGVINHIA